MSFDSTGVIALLAILFVVIGIVGSVVYYFARYYFKTDHNDNELLTKKPIEYGLTKSDSAPRSLNESLSASRQTIWGRLSQVLKGSMGGVVRDQVEEILYTSDLGPQTAEILLAKVSEKLSSKELNDLEPLHAALRSEMLSMLSSVVPFDLNFSKSPNGPVIWMVVGVNGAGKTTTIGKLASLATQQGLKTMIVAGDTFRAAADSQLKAWAERAHCEIYSPENVKDPSAVAYAAIEKAKAQGFDLVIVDTAGRLHTQEHLMEELKKVKRVMAKLDTAAPQATVLVIDANAGQNALEQARQFHAAIGLSAVIVTKLDGSSKAGVVIGVAHELRLPVTHIGVGEGIQDLRPFDPKSFVQAII
jgi:fused signal recognition particle receptor